MGFWSRDKPGPEKGWSVRTEKEIRHAAAQVEEAFIGGIVTGQIGMPDHKANFAMMQVLAWVLGEKEQPGGFHELLAMLDDVGPTEREKRN